MEVFTIFPFVCCFLSDIWRRPLDLRWFGHCQRLPDEGPAKQALTEFERLVQRPVGRPMTTWVEVVK